MSDGKGVYLKRMPVTVLGETQEKAIMELFSSNGRLDDPHNHCVPLLETLVDNCEDRHCFIVMPLLHNFDSPDFKSVDEVLDFVHQTLEVSIGLSQIDVQIAHRHHPQGLVYMHSLNVAHQ